MFLRFFGPDRPAGSLNLRDWDAFIDARRAGRIGPGKAAGPVRDRQIGYDLSWLRAVFAWATFAARDGAPLLPRNPLVGCRVPQERSPTRSILTEAQYRKLLAAAASVNWRLEIALLLANETGHRIKAIRHLRWSDVDLGQGILRWRAERDKIEYEHWTPMTEAALEALQKARRKSPVIGDMWVLPSVRRLDAPCPKGTLDHWFDLAVTAAGLTVPPRSGFHSLRRKFATELKDAPLRDLCDLGGWKDPKTLLTCYQQPDHDAMRRAQVTRRPFGGGGGARQPHDSHTAELTG